MLQEVHTVTSLGWSSNLGSGASIRLEGGTVSNNLDVYPNPSRDVFNVSFTSEDVQNLEELESSMLLEIVYTENLIEFVEDTKQVNLKTLITRGVYFLEITTDNAAD